MNSHLTNISNNLRYIADDISNINTEKYPTCEYIEIHYYDNGNWNNYKYIDDIFRSFTGKPYVWKWDSINGNWNPQHLTHELAIRFPVNSEINISYHNLLRTNKLERILDGDR